MPPSNLSLRLPFLPLPATIVLAGLVAALAGLVAGLPALRLRGFYLAVSTLAVQFFVAWVLNRFSWLSNDSPSGIISAPPLVVAGLSFEDARGRYLFSLTVVTLLTVLAWRLVTSPTGRNFVAVRDNETAARVIGVKVARTKLLAFGLSSFIIGVAGVLWAFAYLRTVEPAGFNLDRSFQILFIVIIGGLGTLRGAFLGAGLIVVLPLLLSRFGAAVTRRRVRFRHAGDVSAHRPRNPDRRLPDPRTRRAQCAPRPRRAPPTPLGLTVQTPETSELRDFPMPAFRTALRSVLVAGTALVALTGSAGADEQHFPLQSYRVGPYAAGGTGFFGGFIDYLNLINTRDAA